MSICIIPARGGSRRIPRKSIRDFHGKPIIAYSIMAAQDSELFDEIFVSTDDCEITNVALDYGAEVLRREPELCEDEVGTQQVAREGLIELLGWGDWDDIQMDYACVIYPCAPMISRLKDGLEAVKEGPYPYAYSVAQDLSDAGMWYWGKVEAFLSREPLGNSFKIRVPGAIDINTEDDWKLAEEMYERINGDQRDGVVYG